AYAELERLIAGLVGAPDCLGMQVTVFDPDYDPDGAYARELVGSLVTGLAPLRPAETAFETPEPAPARVMPGPRDEPAEAVAAPPVVRAPRRSSRPQRGARGA